MNSNSGGYGDVVLEYWYIRIKAGDAACIQYWKLYDLRQIAEVSSEIQSKLKVSSLTTKTSEFVNIRFQNISRRPFLFDLRDRSRRNLVSRGKKVCDGGPPTQRRKGL